SRADLANPKHPRHGNYTGNIPFEAFIESYFSNNPPDYAKVGNQLEFVKDNNGNIGPDRIFKYEDRTWEDHFRELFKSDFDFERHNVSPSRPKDYSCNLR